MTIEDPDQTQGDTAQGTIQEFDSPGLFDSDGEGELGDFSLKMLTQLGGTIENELIPRLMLARKANRSLRPFPYPITSIPSSSS